MGAENLKQQNIEKKISPEAEKIITEIKKNAGLVAVEADKNAKEVITEEIGKKIVEWMMNFLKDKTHNTLESWTLDAFNILINKLAANHINIHWVRDRLDDIMNIKVKEIIKNDEKKSIKNENNADENTEILNNENNSITKEEAKQIAKLIDSGKFDAQTNGLLWRTKQDRLDKLFNQIVAGIEENKNDLSKEDAKNYLKIIKAIQAKDKNVKSIKELEEDENDLQRRENRVADKSNNNSIFNRQGTIDRLNKREEKKEEKIALLTENKNDYEEQIVMLENIIGIKKNTDKKIKNKTENNNNENKNELSKIKNSTDAENFVKTKWFKEQLDTITDNMPLDIVRWLVLFFEQFFGGKEGMKKFLNSFGMGAFTERIDTVYKRNFELSKEDKKAINDVIDASKLNETDPLFSKKAERKDYQEKGNEIINSDNFSMQKILDNKQFLSAELLSNYIPAYNKGKEKKIDQKTLFKKKINNGKEEITVNDKADSEQVKNLLLYIANGKEIRKTIAKTNEELTGTTQEKKIWDKTEVFNKYFPEDEVNDKMKAYSINTEKDLAKYMVTYLFTADKELGYTLAENNLFWKEEEKQRKEKKITEKYETMKNDINADENTTIKNIEKEIDELSKEKEKNKTLIEEKTNKLNESKEKIEATDKVFDYFKVNSTTEIVSIKKDKDNIIANIKYEGKIIPMTFDKEGKINWEETNADIVLKKIKTEAEKNPS